MEAPRNAKGKTLRSVPSFRVPTPIGMPQVSRKAKDAPISVERRPEPSRLTTPRRTVPVILALRPSPRSSPPSLVLTRVARQPSMSRVVNLPPVARQPSVPSFTVKASQMSQPKPVSPVRSSREVVSESMGMGRPERLGRVPPLAVSRGGLGHAAAVKVDNPERRRAGSAQVGRPSLPVRMGMQSDDVRINGLKPVQPTAVKSGRPQVAESLKGGRQLPLVPAAVSTVSRGRVPVVPHVNASGLKGLGIPQTVGISPVSRPQPVNASPVSYRGDRDYPWREPRIPESPLREGE